MNYDQTFVTLTEDEAFCKHYVQARGDAGSRENFKSVLIGYCKARHQLNLTHDRADELTDKLDAHFGYVSLESKPKPKPKKGNRIMDKNLPALLREDAKTIGVKFNSTAKHYTYVTHLPVAVGDSVIVATGATDELQIAAVVRIDDEVKIEPGSDIEYKWVIGIVDMAAALENQKRNEAIQAEAAVIVRNNMRRSFAQQVLGAASEDQRSKLLALTSK